MRLINLSGESGQLHPTHRSLTEALRMRIACVHLGVPPVREREGDLYVLVSHFLRELTPPARNAPSLTPRAWKALVGCSVRDNVRELIWILQHGLAQSDGGEIDVQHLPDEITEVQPLRIERDACRTTPW